MMNSASTQAKTGRKRKKAAAVSRTRKRLRSQMLPKKLY
jgi:small subunit ribosomal protein S21